VDVGSPRTEQQEQCEVPSVQGQDSTCVLHQQQASSVSSGSKGSNSYSEVVASALLSWRWRNQQRTFGVKMLFLSAAAAVAAVLAARL
jgi:hypothetical protein